MHERSDKADTTDTSRGHSHQTTISRPARYVARWSRDDEHFRLSLFAAFRSTGRNETIATGVTTM